MKIRFALAVLLMTTLAAPARSQEGIVVEGVRSRLSAIVRTGSCLAGSQRIDLTDLLRIENTSVRQGARTLRVSGEDFVVETAPGVMEINHVGLMLTHPGDIDIQLQFAMLDRELVLYWRETYQHRSYRQGLFRVAPDGQITPWCEGAAGADSSH